MRKRRQTGAPRRAPKNSLRLSALLLALVAMNVYVFFFRGGTSVRDVLRSQAVRGAPAASSSAPPASVLPHEPAPASANAPATAAAPAAAALPALEDEDARRVEGVMGASDTLAGALKREGLSAGDIDAIVQALRGLWDPRTARGGQSYLVGFDAEGHLRSFEYHATPILTYRVTRTPTGLRGKHEDRPLETRVVGIGGTIEDSLYQAVQRSGESTSLVGVFVDLFSWDINFYVDTQAGDRFKLLVEKRYLGGKFYGYGKVLAAEYAGRVGTFRAFYHPGAGKGSYFDEHGQSIVKSLLKIPLKFVRISSKFDRHRFHPILHSERAHLGVDYAAPQGTPVWASASGRVTTVGPERGSGNTVVLAHAGGLETRYYHLSRFAKGLRVGDTVRQKQVIGYVGMTGLATGPHLHFSVKKDGAFVDPQKLKPTRDQPVPAHLMPAFKSLCAGRMEELTKIETPSLARAPDAR
jgi:murein DD-endopeptidase MepM/ murein hydrolase activator NlpD